MVMKVALSGKLVELHDGGLLVAKAYVVARRFLDQARRRTDYPSPTCCRDPEMLVVAVQNNLMQASL